MNLNSVVQSPEYRAQLENAFMPALANNFLCQALIAKRRRRFLDAAWATLRAAWVCDDSPNHQEQAIACRQSALSLFDRSIKVRARSSLSENVSRVRVDLMRWSGDVLGAPLAVEATMVTAGEAETLSILAFQKHLIEIGDQSAHTVSEAIDFVAIATGGSAAPTTDL